MAQAKKTRMDQSPVLVTSSWCDYKQFGGKSCDLCATLRVNRDQGREKSLRSAAFLCAGKASLRHYCLREAPSDAADDPFWPKRLHDSVVSESLARLRPV